MYGFVTLLIAYLAYRQCSKKLGVTRHDPKFPFCPRGLHQIDFVFDNCLLRSNYLKTEHIVLSPFHELFCFFHGLFDRADHEECLFRDVVMFTFDDFLESPDGVFQGNVTARLAGKNFCDEERLG